MPSTGGPPRPSGRRTAELAEVRALYETTQEICSRLDLDRVLGAIVRRANQLLGGDVAYLATTDDEHQVLRMRAFDNIRSPGFRRLVMDYGVGLGGAVAAKRCPITVPDYLADVGLDHTGQIDEVVREEGLKATVGVPVEFEDQLLAILFVAKRRRATFSAHQITLLASLANSAAIAMHNAQLYAQLARAMSIHENLMEITLRGQGPQPVAEVLAGLINGPVLLVDWAAQVLAAAPGSTELAAPARADLEVAAAGAPEGGGGFEFGGASGRAIIFAGQVEGYLLVRPGPGDAGLARVAIQQGATVFALELAKLRSAEQAEAQSRGDLLDELFRRPLADEATLARRARRLGLDLATPTVVGMVRPVGAPAGDVAERWRRVVRLARFGRDPATPMTAVTRGDGLVLLIATDSPEAAEAVARRLVRDCRDAKLPALVIGLGRVCRDVRDYGPSFAEADRAAGTAHLGRLAPVVSFAALDYHQLVLGARPSADLVGLATIWLEPLLTHDRTTPGGALVSTLRGYLSCCGNVEATARGLAVHPNTLRARVARIEELTGRDLRDAATRLDLHLALATLDLAG